MGVSFPGRRYLIAGFTIFASITLLPAYGQSQDGHIEARFLLIPPDARGRALGEGGSVFSKGAISAYYNPALLVTSELFSGEFNYSDYAPDFVDGMSTKNIFISNNIDDMVFCALGYTRFDFSNGLDIPEYESESYDYSLGIWAAVSFDPHNSLGAGIKYIKRYHQSSYMGSDYVSSREGSSYAFDFGLLSRNHLPVTTLYNDTIYYPVLHKLFKVERDRGFSFGISLANVGKAMTFFEKDRADPIPRNFRFAAGYQAIDTEPVGLRLTLDATKLLIDVDDSFKEEWNEIVWSYGLEATFYYILHFRLGRLFDRDSYQRFNTVGFGIGPEWLSLDYSTILGDTDDWRWNRRAEEYSISIRCNISPNDLNL
ncbi:MAG: PorV/PorQ family protein [Candidatus Zixiibacteriota bacterium]|nr:MAG: PorV/PorQ family protein [candidate division Zixibacteria bacterium]